MKKTLIVFAGIALATAGIGYFYTREKTAVYVSDSTDTSGTEQTEAPISIEYEDVQKEHYSGTIPVIKGQSQLAQTARTYVETRVREFETQAADAAQAGDSDSSLPGSYTIGITANLSESPATMSVAIGEYGYTGGAHGSSAFRVFTASKATGEILSLENIIQDTQKESFTALVKEKLLAWRPDGGDGPAVFEEDVAGLVFQDFKNFSLDGENLILYFSQYEIGPGVLGAFPFPIPLAEISAMLR